MYHEQTTDVPVPLLLAPNPYQDETNWAPEAGELQEMSSTLPPPPPPPILVIDPGKVSGVAFLNPGAVMPVNYELSVFDTINFYIHIGQGNNPVVLESFQISERTIKTALSLDALDIIGYIKMDRLHRGFAPPVMQTVSSAKTFADDAKLKAAGWFNPSKDGHMNDANRHLMVYLARHHRAWFNHFILPSIAKEIL